jgi:REP element-mobilizing transposase RayT
MARPPRNTPGGYCYHVLSRGNGRQTVFHKAGDYEAFVGLFDAAQEVVPMRVLAYCLMPNHFHLVLWPRGDGDLSRNPEDAKAYYNRGVASKAAGEPEKAAADFQKAEELGVVPPK